MIRLRLFPLAVGVLVTTAVLGSEPLTTLPPQLSLKQTLDLFSKNGLDLIIAEAQIQGAQGDLRSAGALKNLTASFGAGPAVNCFKPGCHVLSDVQYIASLSDNTLIEDVASGKRGLRMAVANKALESARLNRKDAERQLRFQVKTQFLELLSDQQALQLAKDVQVGAKKIVDLVTLRYQSGAVSEADVARLSTQELETEQAVDTAQRDVDTDQATLAFLLGFRGITPRFSAAEPALMHFTQQPQLDMARQGPERFLDDALETRPDFAAARVAQERAELAVALARRNIVPDMALSFQYVQQGFGGYPGDGLGNPPQPPTFAIVLSATLPFLYQQQGEIARAQADAYVGTLELQRTRNSISSDLQASAAQLVSAEKLVQRMEGGLLKRATEARDLVTIQYQKGAASLLDYLDAQRTFIAANSEYLQNVKDYWTAVFRLEQTLGRESDR